MLEVNIRTFSEKAGKGMFLDYHEHMKLMNSDIKHEVKTFLNDPDCIQVYQYYSAFPLCLLEAKMLRRMNIGMSVCYIDKSVEEYLKTNPLPAIIKKWYLKYLVCFFNSMDSIVVSRENVQEKMKAEGIRNPEYHWIENTNVPITQDIVCRWLAIYKQGLQHLHKRQICAEKNLGSCSAV